MQPLSYSSKSYGKPFNWLECYYRVNRIGFDDGFFCSDRETLFPLIWPVSTKPKIRELSYPDGNSKLMLVTTSLRHIAVM